jgi:TatD DNase family protein
VGEIGLDFYVADYDKEQQITYFNQQLALAQTYNLPVILHVRSAIDEVIKILKNYPHIKGIVHAFNGSRQQADQLIKKQFKLGFGGAMTYSRALHIQRLATELPIESIVLETDAPDMNPSWLAKDLDNHPNQLPQIAAFFAQLRNISLEKLALQMKQNLQEVMPQIGTC